MTDSERVHDLKRSQVGGTHYNKHEIQPWDIIDEYGLDYYRGNAIKYILRNKMDPYEDIEKAIHYLKYWLEINKPEREGEDVSSLMRTAYFAATGQYSSDEEIKEWLRRDNI